MLRAVARFLCWTLPIILWDGLRLLALVFALLPGFLRFAWYYFWSSKRKSVRYGHDSCRQTLDVYSPISPNTNNNTVDDDTTTPHALQSSTSLLQRPVVVFYTGGAWLVGYKMWGALLARALAITGIVIVMPDYRNYPWAAVPAAVQDVQESLQWTLDHIHDYGGDPENVVVVGQSAGGHLAATALLRLAIQSLEDDEPPPEDAAEPIEDDESMPEDAPDEESPAIMLRATSFRGFISLSAPYSLTAMQKTFVKHGLNEALVDRIFGGERDAYDPQKLVHECNSKELLLSDYLPPMRIYHGSCDKTVPPEGSEEFVRELEQAGVNVQFHMYEGWSHTDPILEGPMDADHRFHRDIHSAVQEWTDDAADGWPADSAVLQRSLCPHFLIRLARFVNPF